MKTGQRILFKSPISAISFVIHMADIVLFFMASLTAYRLHLGLKLVDPISYSQVTLLGAILLSFSNHFLGLYSGLRGKSLVSHLAKLMLSVALVIASLLAVIFFTHSGLQYSRVWFALLAVFAFVYLSFFRLFTIYALRKLRKRGYFQKNIIIVGVGSLAQELALRVQGSNWEGYKLASFWDDQTQDLKPNQNQPADARANIRLKKLKNIPIGAMPEPEELTQFISENNIAEVWIALPLGAQQQMRKILACLDQHVTKIRYFPDLFEFGLINHSVQPLLGMPSIDIRSTPMVGVNRLMKSCEDKMIASIILILISPVMVLLAIGVKLSSKGPVFYKQERLGWNGKSFNMLKFRSMPVGIEKKTGAVWAKKGEHRATKLGAIMRKTSLDELPQFINVLKGDMSIVGPRPERPMFVEEFKKNIPGYMQKHLVKAGITGWAQVNGWRGNTSLNKRIEFDLYYINHWSLLFDLRIIVLTIIKGFFDKNAY